MKVCHERSGREGVHQKFMFPWSEIQRYTKLQRFSEKEKLDCLLTYFDKVCLPYECEDDSLAVKKYGQSWTRFNDMENFTFLKKIGEGSYGHVYKVKHKSGSVYAMKLFDVLFSERPCSDQWDPYLVYEFCIGRREAVFLLEATLAKKNKHIPKFYDFGFCILNGRARSYILMEYVKGRSIFGSSLSTRTDFEDMTRQVFDAVKDIHSLGYAHCDISPMNLMMTKDGEIKVIDFGTAAKEEEAEDYIMGSINPPENWSGKTLTFERLFAVDVWCAAYSLLTVARGRATKNLLPHQNTLVECLDDLCGLIKDAELNTVLPFVLYEALSVNPEERPRF
ncbi:putative serine/threonine protein kinase [Insectomime virus]|uniref:Serine/threonine protein kinase n=1 Tax=Tunisvirus fontaine2 TaxID=1421067 RepID=V9SE18_9VIRU|nr:serine/threonine protein kinase [Tunisvirus fontaine2]AHA46268.1 putative serine/threonine protein kinase [Insectomime virus]AHC55148.1 serine/threonine protein kinase [Tunisvirus fontaine2]